MKKLLLIVLALACYSVQAQKWGREFGISYAYANPTGGMGHIIQRGHGFGVNYGWVTPDNRFALGADIGYAIYGRDKSRQNYALDDGSVAPMDIIVSNSFANFAVYGKWYFAAGQPVRPYFTGRLGYSRFSTDLNIYDPDDLDHCEPVESEVLYNDGTVIAAVGAGAKLDIASIFKKLQTGIFYLDGTLTLTQGGHLRYMNADAPTQHHHHGAIPDADVVTAPFVNTQTKIVHQHHVGYLYKSPMQMLELRVGFSMTIAR